MTTSTASSKVAGAASNDDYSLRQHTKAFLRRWRESLGTQWQPRQANVLYEDLERLAAIAEEHDVAEIADPVLELAVYLCSFVDSDTAPNSVQRQGLEHLIERLAGATRGSKSDHPPHQISGGSAMLPRQVFYLRSDARELPGLAARLGKEGCIVRPFDARDRLELALDKVSPDFLLIDQEFVTDVHALTEAAQRKRPAHRDQPLCLVLADNKDRSRVLFAQRAGADAIVTERDPIVLASQLDQLLAQRRALAYRVLIVEDDRSQAKFCDSILRHCGMITCICEDAARVAATLGDFKPDLVLLDMYLPGSNGIEIAQYIRAQPRHAFLPIIFLTGEHDQELRFDAIRVGADDFITKPVKPRHLVTAVESRIKRARELHAGHPEHRGERRGILSARDVLTREMLRLARDEQEHCPVLAFIAVDDVDKVAHNVGFVAAGTLPQQIAAALAAELAGERTLCAWGEMRYLALLSAPDELTLRETLEELRRRLDARLWLSDETPVHLDFSLGCTRLPAEVAKIDEVLERARAMCVNAQKSGGARCEFDLRLRGSESDEDPLHRLVRAILRTPNLRGTGHIQFQPLIPLSGQIAGQYDVRMELIPEKFSHALHLKRADYLPIARELDMVPQADRQCLRSLLNLVQERRSPDQALRLHVPMSVETVLDSAFAPWLAAELRSHGVSGSTFVLHLLAQELHVRLAQAKPSLESLQRLGLRLGVELRNEDGKIARELLQVESINVIKFVRPDDNDADVAWNHYASFFKEARLVGKTVLASGVQHVGELSILLRIGTHYVQGEVLGPWSREWNFDFSSILRGE